MTNKLMDLEEMLQLLLQYRKNDPIGCAELCGRLIQADQDRLRIVELQKQIDSLTMQLAEVAG